MEALAEIGLHWNSTSHQFDSAPEAPGETVTNLFIYFFHFDKKKKLCIREPLLLQQLFTPNTSVFRFTTVAKMLLEINNQLLKQQDWNQFNLHAKFVLSLFKKLVTK